VVGKWHLGGSPTFNPESLGMDFYAGLLTGVAGSYYSWQLTEGGSTVTNTGYITEVLTDKAIDWVKSQDGSWFLWLAYNAPHTPFHVPPAEMYSQGDLPEYVRGMDPLPYYMAAIEAMDYQIGRLLDSMTAVERDDTTIIFIGDNGTPGRVAQSPYSPDRVKGTLYQGGINTPMFVSGNRVTRAGTDDSLINGTDLFATIAQLAGVDNTEIHDSRSFLPLLSAEGPHHQTQYSEMNDGTDDLWTIRDRRYKLIVNANGPEEMYDLISDPYEVADLLSGTLDEGQSLAKVELEAQLDSIRR
jgi:arylsulfatase B